MTPSVKGGSQSGKESLPASCDSSRAGVPCVRETCTDEFRGGNRRVDVDGMLELLPSSDQHVGLPLVEPGSDSCKNVGVTFPTRKKRWVLQD